MPSPLYWYWASVSNNIPMLSLTQRQHLEKFVTDRSNLKPFYLYSARQHLETFYANSTSLPSGTLEQRVNAYYAAQTNLPSGMSASIRLFVITTWNDMVEEGSTAPTTNLFTANFGDKF